MLAPHQAQPFAMTAQALGDVTPALSDPAACAVGVA